MKKLIFILSLFTSVMAGAQTRQPAIGDTLIIEVGKSKLLFIVNDLKDIEKIKNYDLNKIIQRLQGTLESDSTIVLSLADIEVQKDPQYDTAHIEEGAEVTEVETNVIEINRHIIRDHSFNMELGMNNYLEDGGDTPSSDALYNVRPWGSWYVGLGWKNSISLSRHFYIEAGGNVTWYNFKFERDDAYVIRGDEEVEFIANPQNLDASFDKSKLTVAYLNATVVPMFNFGKKGMYHGFRIGMGAYAGYRLGSYSKVKYDDGDTEKKKNHDSFYLNDFRYGVRLQTGYKGTDLFFNYDLNELFRKDKGPALNAISFGIIF